MLRKQPVVAQCFHSYLPLTENWIYSLISNLADIKTVIAAEHYERTNFFNANFSYIEFPVKHLQWVGHRSIFVRLFDFIVTHLKKKYFSSFIATQIRNHSVSLMHAHFAFVAWDYLPIARRLGIPIIVSFYGCDYEYYPRSSIKWQKRYEKLFNDASLFICEGENGRRILENMGCNSRKIAVCHLGVDLDKISFVKREKKLGQLKLIQIGRFTEKKGHIYTIEAFGRALRNCPEMELTILGKGDDVFFNQLKTIAADVQCIDKLKWIESIPYERLSDLLKEYHVCIQPSCYASDGDCEGGAPVVLLDAQSSGMPVISTKHCDIPEVVKDHSSGFLVDERDVAALAEVIESFYNMEQNQYSAMAEAARIHVASNYDVKKQALQLETLYHKVLSKRDDI